MALAKGGLAKNPTLALIGESAQARRGGGEFVAPVALGADLITERIMKNLKANTPENRYSNLSPAIATQRVELGGEVRVDGHDLRIALTRAYDDQNQYS
ncbi:hypothetical protein IC229_26255 [Spirosoma sp. BT702]|uniref:Uncharacterized protein n=1 Tax=Spirosoma profusum TaxID=2771354 RepID=A0A927APD9_9BACT|nr:hypothetical protein [Spirosoma profusum]MBD2704174.1 hypothetical protein [Spirosoma profusum]